MATRKLREREKTSYTLSEDVAGRKVLFVNHYLIGAPGEGNPWVLVDAALPGSAKRLIKEAEELFGKNNPPQAIILTHGHFDHVGALPELLKYWTRVKVYAHPLELPFLTGRSAYPPPDPTAGKGGLSYMSWAFPVEAYDFRNRIEALPVDGTLPYLDDWRYINTPGHSPGHISLFRDRDRMLIAGDAFTTTNQNSLKSVLVQKKEMHGPPAYFTLNWQDSFESIRKLFNLNPEIAGTGHGLPQSGEELRSNMQRLLNTFKEKEIPTKGRYTDNPPETTLEGVRKMPNPVSFETPRIIAGLLGAMALTGAAWYLVREIQRNRGKTKQEHHKVDKNEECY